MKFLLGFITGVVSAVLIMFIVGVVLNNENPTDTRPGLTLFPEKKDCLTDNELTIFQVLEPTMALAEYGEYPEDSFVLLINNENQHYYDDQKIQIPVGSCAKQIGVYSYETNAGLKKTVPVVVIE